MTEPEHKSVEETSIKSLNELHISSDATTVPPIAPSDLAPDVWKEPDDQPRRPAPDLSILDESITAPVGEPVLETTVRPDEELLNEFDPLANEQEKNAREAWASSESHPPPAPIPVPSTPEPIHQPYPSLPPASSTSGFASLAALARTFQIPSLPKNRPLSFDVAKPVPSPATLSLFASQQQRPQILGRDDDVGSNGSRSRPGSGTSSPRPGVGDRGKDKDKDKDPPFDFQNFLDQMKTKSAEPVAKYLRSFLSNFSKRTFTVTDQVKIINDFLNFISTRMREIDIWRNASPAEFDNAMEGMEKLVMNRLYEFTFTPQVARAIPPRPITADDLERDRVLSQRIALFTWIEEKNLDIPEGEGSKGFLMFAQQELLKINHYKAPRDKLICILNCCKVIFGLIRHLKKDEGADSFVPILIFVVLKANPDHLLSNVEFINRFRNPEKLQSEAGYYLSSLMGAVSFIETMDHTSLSNITQEEFEKNVEEAIQSLPVSEPTSPSASSSELSTPRHSLAIPSSFNPTSPHAGEESAQPLTLPTPGPSENARRLLQKTGDTISKPLSAIKQIFNEALDGAETLTYLPGPFTPFEIGRENRHEKEHDNGSLHWSHPDQVRQYRQQSGSVPQTPLGVGESGQQVGSYGPPIQTPYKPRVRRVPSPSPALPTGPSPDGTPMRYGFNPPGPFALSGPYTKHQLSMGPSQPLTPPRVQSLARPPSPLHVSRTATPSLDFANMQAEIDQAHDRAAEASKSTLRQIFPATDTEVIQWVLEANEGDLGKSIEALLEMSSGS